MTVHQQDQVRDRDPMLLENSKSICQFFDSQQNFLKVNFVVSVVGQ